MATGNRSRAWLTAAVALAIAAGGCQLVVDLDGLEDQHCPPGHKPCPNLGCVPNDNPGTGCNDPGCAPCAPPHAIATCGQNLHCFFNRDSCIPGWDDCDGRPDNGCETDLSHNRDHCGTCTKSCDKPTNGIAGCSNGECGIGGCNPSWEDCDHDPANGCEHPIWTDQECLGCGLPCPGGMSCDQGVCI